MAGAAIFAAALVTVLVFGTYLIQAAILAIQVAFALATVAAYAIVTVLGALLWCVLLPFQSWEDRRRSIAMVRRGVSAGPSGSPRPGGPSRR